MKTISVVTHRPYDILIEEGALNNISKYLLEKYTSPRKVCVITDSNVGSQYADQIVKNLQAASYDAFRIVFPSGEHSKNLTTFTNILEAMADSGLSRSDIVLALGGGVVSDIAGFAAGTYMRGIDFVFVPTTLLAIIDSSVGGKNAVNLLSGKNLAGLFWGPSMVIVDPEVLNSLEDNCHQDGLVEALKSAVISDSGLVSHIENRNFDYIIERCISIKKALVEVDEYDLGLRQLLSFGHTLGHCIEKLSSYSISHGVAVAKGMVGESRAAYKLGYCKTDISPELARILKGFGIDTSVNYDPQELYEHALVDKKIKDGTINMIVPEVIGKCTTRRISLYDLQKFMEAAVD